MFKKVQQAKIFAYRGFMQVSLWVIILGVASYGLIAGCFFLNRSWAAPLTLSPTQERVLAFQPQVALMEAGLLKQRVDLATAQAKYQVGIQEIAKIDELMARLDSAQRAESEALAATNASVQRVLRAKNQDIAETKRSVSEAREMMKVTDAELAAGLITKDQAQSRRISLQGALNSSTDALAQALTLQEQGRLAESGSFTLRGGSTSLQALQAVQENAQLRLMRTQLVVDTETARLSIEQLSESIEEVNRVLAVTKNSPYYQARYQPVGVLFMPYENMTSMKPGDPVYDCYLKIAACRRVGSVERTYDAEEYARHPIFKSDIKGRFVAVHYEVPSASESMAVFVGGKPLLF